MKQYLNQKDIKSSVRNCIMAMPDNPICYQLVFSDDYFWSWNYHSGPEFLNVKRRYSKIKRIKITCHKLQMINRNIFWWNITFILISFQYFVIQIVICSFFIILINQHIILHLFKCVNLLGVSCLYKSHPERIESSEAIKLSVVPSEMIKFICV